MSQMLTVVLAALVGIGMVKAASALVTQMQSAVLALVTWMVIAVVASATWM